MAAVEIEQTHEESAVATEDPMQILVRLLERHQIAQIKATNDGFESLKKELARNRMEAERYQRFTFWLIAVLVFGLFLKMGVDLSQMAGLLPALP